MAALPNLIPDMNELRALVEQVRRLDDLRDQAWNRRNLSTEDYLEYEIVNRRYRMASDHLGDRLKAYIESGASGMVRP